MPEKTSSPIKLSVVIPTYNAASWLPKTIPKIERAMQTAGIKTAEILVVDDGSTDGSGEVAKALKTRYPMRVVRQPNGGRFLARKLGTAKANYGYILFIDTRIYIKPNALKFLVNEMAGHPERQVWTSHVHLDKTSNMYARFWEAITFLAWRKYFAHPRDYSYGLKEFDRFPKGTTCFFAPKAVMAAANEWFLTATKGSSLSTANDDTLLIREIAAHQPININPQFACTYHARSSFRQYLRHVHHRGKVFVDGFFRRDGNKFYWLIWAFLIGTIAVPVTLIVLPFLIGPAVLAVLAAWLLMLVFSLSLGVETKDALSLFVLAFPFALFYGAGIWAAIIKIYTKPRHRSPAVSR